LQETALSRKLSTPTTTTTTTTTAQKLPNHRNRLPTITAITSRPSSNAKDNNAETITKSNKPTFQQQQQANF